jgi:hypothetical protein
MNRKIEDDLIKKRNMLYYNQLVLHERKARDSRSTRPDKKRKKQTTSFGSQKIDLKDFLFIPEKFEVLFYLLYGIGVPYISGTVFLFFFVANGSYENFKLLNTDAFLIVWLIGYEIVAIFSLIWILFLYLQYDTEEEYF